MCLHCKENFIAKATSSEISWQGNAVSELDVCIGDSLTYVGNIILSKIKDLLKGKGILLDDLTLDDCEYLEDLLDDEEKNLLNVLKLYKEAICDLKTDQDDLKEKVDQFTNVAGYTLACIGSEDPCGDELTFKGLIQAVLTKLCNLNTQFESIAETILDAIEEGAGNFLLSGAVTSCGGNGIAYSGSGATVKVTLQALVPPYAPILYTGSTSLFDSGGVGLPGTALCGWYLCNGANGTPNSSSLPQNLAGDLKYIIRFN